MCSYGIIALYSEIYFAEKLNNASKITKFYFICVRSGMHCIRSADINRYYIQKCPH